MDAARTAANDAIEKIATGQSEALQLISNVRHIYLRAHTALEGIEKEIDTAVEEYAEAIRLLAWSSIYSGGLP